MNKAVWIAVGLFFIGLLAFFLLQEREKEYSWQERYEQQGMQPYDLDLLYGLLNELKGRDLKVDMEQRIPQALPLDAELGTKRPSYIFVGNYPRYSVSEADSLLLFVERGGTALISSEAIPKDFVDYLYFDGCRTENGAIPYWQNYHIGWDSSVALNMTHPALKAPEDYKLTHRNREGVASSSWSFIPDVFLCDNSRYPWAKVGSFNFVSSWAGNRNRNYSPNESVVDFSVDTGREYVNFVRISYGEGFVYLHTQPKVFSNYFLREKAIFEYANKVFSHLPTGKIYWDKVSEVAKREEQAPTRQSRGVSDTPLKYILAQPALRWAWYVLLGGALFFILFRAKRRQRIIPVVEENRNTSLAFVKTIGSLYFQQSNHKHLLLQQMQLFLSRMRQRYGLQTRNKDEEMRKRLAERAEVPQAEVDEIFDLYAKVERAEEVKESTLIRFYNLLERFYQQAK